MTPQPQTGRIPVSVIGGFLGSGKTTLLNHLLAHNAGRRLAVLVNDFGAINIDAALVRSREADVLSLANGCVCCQTGGDLSDALIAVIERQPPPDAIVIEASGVSDPWRIAQVSLADPMLALDGVVVLIDAAAVRAQAVDPLLADTVMRQLDAADLLVLNHCDRVDTTELAGLREWLDARLPATPRFEARFAQVPAALLGGPLAAPTQRASAWRCAAGCTLHDHGDPARHDLLFDSWSAPLAGKFDDAALRALLRAMPRGVLRLKGLLRTERHGWAELQFAGKHGSLRAWPAQAAVPDGEGSIVAIGLRGQLPRNALQAALAAARTAEPHAAAVTVGGR